MSEKKALLVARIGKFFSDFEISDIRILQSMGYEVWCVGNYEPDNHRLDDLGVKKVHFDFVRSPISPKNFKEMKRLARMISEEGFEIMHCHMPIGGVMARLAAHKAGLKPVIYTAHGFQFCKGGPVRDWMLFYPVEKFLSRYTDLLITMNEEDYSLAKNKMYAKAVEYIPGVGVDTDKYLNAVQKRDELIKELGIEDESPFLFLAVGELSARKNHETAIRGLAEAIKSGDPRTNSFHLIIVGIGPIADYVHALPKELGIEDKVHFLGWRDDIPELNKSVDCFVFPSLREGLPLALMEAMAAGKPAIASIARGNTELVDEGVNGFLVEAKAPMKYAEAMIKMSTLTEAARTDMGEASLKKIKNYDINIVREKMEQIYAGFER